MGVTSGTKQSFVQKPEKTEREMWKPTILDLRREPSCIMPNNYENCSKNNFVS